MSILHKLQWRYATKKFDPEKIVAEEDITELLKAMNLSASSSGLQPYKFIVIHNKELQQQLRSVSFDQPQITDASHLIVIVAKNEVSPEDIKAYVSRTAEIRNIAASLDGLEQSLLKGIASKNPIEQLQWAQRQCYLPLATLLIAAADLKIDTCPMEGFIPEEYDRILGLSEQGLHATVIAAIGYRSREDNLQHAKKSRRTLDDIVELRYGE